MSPEFIRCQQKKRKEKILLQKLIFALPCSCQSTSVGWRADCETWNSDAAGWRHIGERRTMDLAAFSPLSKFSKFQDNHVSTEAYFDRSKLCFFIHFFYHELFSFLNKLKSFSIKFIKRILCERFSSSSSSSCFSLQLIRRTENLLLI